MCSRQVSKWTLQHASVGTLAVQHGIEGDGNQDEVRALHSVFDRPSELPAPHTALR